MRSVVLADAGPLYATADCDDSLHERSLEEQERLEAEGLRTIVSYTTLQEAHGLALRKLGPLRARVLLEELAQTAIFLTPTEEDYKGAMGRVLHYPDQDVSLADALLAGIGDRLGVPVWTYDHHFDTLGVRVWHR